MSTRYWIVIDSQVIASSEDKTMINNCLTCLTLSHRWYQVLVSTDEDYGFQVLNSVTSDSGAEADTIESLKAEMNKYGEKVEVSNPHRFIGLRVEYQQAFDDQIRLYQVIRRCGSSSQEGWLFSLREVKGQPTSEPWTYYTSRNIVLTEHRLESILNAAQV